MPGKDKPKQKDDFSWVKTDAHRIINKLDFAPKRPHTSTDSSKVNMNSLAVAVDTPRKVTEVHYAQSSSTVLPSDEEQDKTIHTTAISYRPVLSSKQKALMQTCDYEGHDPIYEGFNRGSSGYPLVHSKRKRVIKSAPAVERNLVLPKSRKGQEMFKEHIQNYNSRYISSFTN